jgi:hypothetical protein
VSDQFVTVIATEEGARAAFIAAMNHAKCMFLNGERVELRVGPALDPIRAKQRKFLKDIVFGQIAEQVCVGEKRERFTKEIWAEFFRRRLLGDRFEMRKLPGAKKATPHKVRNSTEELGVRKYAAYTDQVIDIAVAEHGVEFVFETGEREAVRHVSKKDRQPQS